MSARPKRASTTGGLPSEAYWRSRAERSRLCAAAMTTDEAREALLGIAIVYDSMADRAARREARARRRAANAAPTASAAGPESTPDG